MVCWERLDLTTEIIICPPAIVPEQYRCVQANLVKTETLTWKICHFLVGEGEVKV